MPSVTVPIAASRLPLMFNSVPFLLARPPADSAERAGIEPAKLIQTFLTIGERLGARSRSFQIGSSALMQLGGPRSAALVVGGLTASMRADLQQVVHELVAYQLEGLRAVAAGRDVAGALHLEREALAGV